MKQRWYRFYATGFGLGYLRGPTGTYGAAFGLLLYTLLARWEPLWLHALLAAPLFFLSVKAADSAAGQLGKKDPKEIVCDEIFGQWCTLLLFPFHWKSALVGLLAFRFFDITKPFPARRLEHLPGGWGIVMDDLMAAVYAHLLLQALFHYKVLH